jgi:solute carrier family 25 aspartate/glutamate transporter 12/13
MADISKARVVVKEKLLGTDQAEEVKLSAQSKTTFEKNARRDEETGELFMNQEDFINAIAPVGEDYVSLSYPWRATYASSFKSH